MCRYSDCNSSISDCTFIMNSAQLGSGIARFFDCYPTLNGCTFDQSFGPVRNEGAGMYNYSSGSSALSTCTFMQNTARNGGGMMSLFDCIPDVVNGTFLGNTATDDGGGTYNYSNSHTELTNCLLSSNTEKFRGAVINLFTSDPVLTNCTLVGNSATAVAGGVYSHQSTPELANTLLWANHVGGVMDQAAQIAGFNSSQVVHFCSIQGGAVGLGGANNDGSDPLFVDADGSDDVYGTLDDSPRLQAGSLAAIDTGDTAAVPAGVVSDLDDGPRVLNGTVDRGAYEWVPGRL